MKRPQTDLTHEIKLPHPFPRHGSPDKRPRIAIYAAYPHDWTKLPHSSLPQYRRIIVQIFTEFYAAEQFVRIFTTDPLTLEPLPYRWLDHNSFHVPSTNTRVYTRPYGRNTPSLEDVVEYEPTRPEREYRLPPSTARQPHILTRPFTTTLTIDPEEAQPTRPLELEDNSPSRTRGTRTRSTPLKLSGRVHVSVIATSLNITPREARQALRTSKTAKPQGGWWFSPDDVQKYTDIIKANLKKK